MNTLGICPPPVAERRVISLFHPVVPAAAHERVAQVLGSRWLGLGPVTEEFEHVFAKKIGARHAVAVNSGTAALHLALRLLGIGPGDEVILPANTFVATGHVILYEGATPVFADIDPATGNLDPGHLRTVLSPRTAAVIAVHYAGAPCAIAEIRAVAASAGAVVVEDCAHVCGATYAGQPLAASGTFQAYSFQATKVLAVGEGGALVVPTEQDADRARRLRRLGIGPRQGSGMPTTGWDYGVEEVGLKCARPSAHHEQQQLGHADHGRQRDQLMADLAAVDVGTGVHFRRIDSYPMYQQADLPGTEWFWRHQLSLPIHMAMTVDDVGYICDAIERSTADTARWRR